MPQALSFQGLSLSLQGRGFGGRGAVFSYSKNCVQLPQPQSGFLPCLAQSSALNLVNLPPCLPFPQEPLLSILAPELPAHWMPIRGTSTHLPKRRTGGVPASKPASHPPGA